MKRRHRILVYDGDEEMGHLSDLRQEYELVRATSPESLQGLAAQNSIDAVLIHHRIFSYLQIDLLEKLNGFAARLPTIILADHWDLDAVKHCGKLGIHTVLDCSEKFRKKSAAISSAACRSGFRHLLAEAGKPTMAWSPRMKRAYELIGESFPNAQSVCELSAALHIHRRSFEKEFRETFGLTYVQFVRVMCMYESWHLMQYTDLDNSDIALSLQYREETHFARDCRKVFDLNPTQLRKLSEKEFFDLLKKSFFPAK
jgi:AraC-like DNA-binding protein